MALSLVFDKGLVNGVVGAAEELVGLVVPAETRANDVILEGEEGIESLIVESATRREGAGDVSRSALVGEDPEVELGEEACEVREGNGGP